MSHNTDELVAPKWLDKEFFENILKTSENDLNLVVRSFQIGSASKKGEHFASVIYRASILYESRRKTHKISLIVKTQPFEEGIKRDMLVNRPIFDNEIRMYSKTIPEMQRLMKLCGDETILSPKLYYHSKSPTDLLVLEDLSEMNERREKFVVRLKLVNFDECKLITEQLAKWHACSMYMKHDNKFNDEFDKYKYHFFNGVIGEEVIKFSEVNFEIFSNEVKKWPGFEQYQKNLENFKNNLVKLGIQHYAANPEGYGYNVLNHGDLIVKNLMMKIENAQMVDFRFIDFQFCNYSSPVLDLSYILHCLSEDECREKYREELIYFYHQTFVSTLEKLKFSGHKPTMTDLQIEFLRHGFFEVHQTFAFIPYVYIDFEDLPFQDLFNFEDQKSRKLKEWCYAQPELTPVFKKFLLEFIRKGYL